MNFFTRHKIKRQRLLRKMEAMRAAKARAAKARRQMERGPRQEEPRMVRTTCLSLGVRDDLTGAVAWEPLRSGRDAARRIAVVLREYRPGAVKRSADCAELRR